MAQRGTTSGRFVGITVMPEYSQVETVAAALDAIQGRARATAITTCPYVMSPAEVATGTREPPIDAGAGLVRQLDRPLWGGRRELFVTTAPAFAPDRSLYRGLRFQPPEPTALTGNAGAVVADAIVQAKARGLEVHLQVQAACPPGYRVGFGGPAADDLPRLPDGSLPHGRVDNNASLASPEIRAYLRAVIADLCRAFPAIDGVRLDWPEYPPYRLEDLFFDFSEPARHAAVRMGFDFERMRRDALAGWRGLTGGAFGAAALAALQAPGGGPLAALHLLSRYPGILDLLRFRAGLVAEFLAEARDALSACGGDRLLSANAFPPPWSLLSGFDFRLAASRCDAICVKLYTMHWPMILRFYADRLLSWSPSIDADLLARTLAELAGIGAGDQIRGLDDLRYPGNEDVHPVPAAAQRQKIAWARADAQAGGGAAVRALVHGYGPVGDFRNRLRAALDASDSQVWINRYGYLSDAKLDAVGALAVG
jgi:hypothetical protein